MATVSYSFLDTSANIQLIPGGVVDLTQGSEGGISITQENSQNQRRMGASGDWMNVLVAGRPANVQVKFLKNSPAHTLLTAAYNIQSINSAAWGQNSITVKHSALGDLAVFAGVAFTKYPDLIYDVAGEMMTWGFECGRIDFIRAKI